MNEDFQIPIKCKGISVILLKRTEGEYKVLLLKRATKMLRNAWCFIGGSIENGEKAWEAALREINEETGITRIELYNSNKFELFYSFLEDYVYVAPVFVGYVDEKEDVKLNYEHIDYRWLSFSEAITKVELPGNEEILQFIEKYFAKRKPLKWLMMDTITE